MITFAIYCYNKAQLSAYPVGVFGLIVVHTFIWHRFSCWMFFLKQPFPVTQSALACATSVAGFLLEFCFGVWGFSFLSMSTSTQGLEELSQELPMLWVLMGDCLPTEPLSWLHNQDTQTK